MRPSAESAVRLLLGIACAGSPLAAQTSGLQNVVVVVENGLPQPPQPVKAVRVSLSYLDSSVPITDAQQVTNSQGQALLAVSPGAAQRGNLRVQVTGSGNLVIYQPADGQLPALPATVNISMLPKGSPALLGPAQIEAMLHRSLLQVSNLQKQVSSLRQDVAAAQAQKPDLGAAIAEWARANGFAVAQADSQVKQWAQEIQRDSARATAEQMALAEVALKHYASAAQLFNQAADTDAGQLDAEEAQEKALLENLRKHLQQLINDREQSADASQLNLQYHQATQTLESAETTAEAEYKKHPDDTGFEELWLQADSAAAFARWQESRVSPAKESLSLLAQSAGDFESLAKEYAALGDRRDWAEAQRGLGNALWSEGARVTGDKAAAFLGQATQAYEKALEVDTKADLPQEWASTQNSLGNVLALEGGSATGDRAVALLNQAAQAYQKALEVRTKTDLPRDWATTENNLGVALRAEGERTQGDKAMVLHDQAVQAFENALEVRTKTDLPRDWAITQNNLGDALSWEGEHAAGEESAILFDQAVQAYQKALEVLSKADLPQDWAATQNKVGTVLLDEGENGGDKAADLLDRAIQAFDKALEVQTKADLPRLWANTHANLEEADFAAARYDNCIEAAAVLTDDSLSRSSAVDRDALKLACQCGAGDKDAALATEKALLAEASHAQTEIWDFSGAIRVLSRSPAFDKGRTDWIALFTAVQKGDSDGITAALGELEPILQP
jgi:hypothetical protein